MPRAVRSQIKAFASDKYRFTAAIPGNTPCAGCFNRFLELLLSVANQNDQIPGSLQQRGFEYGETVMQQPHTGLTQQSVHASFIANADTYQATPMIQNCLQCRIIHKQQIKTKSDQT